MKPVKMYSSMICIFCIRAKSLLKKKGVDFEDISVDMRPAVRNEMTKLTGKTSVPQIWIGEQHIGGYSEIAELEAQGSLDSLLHN